MAVVITTDLPKAERISRNLSILTGTITFPSSYSYGGEAISGDFATGIADYFHGDLLSLHCAASAGGGYSYLLDKTSGSEKVKVFANAPAIVFEEKHTASSKAVTLDYPAAWIVNVAKAGQGMIWVTTGTAAPSTNEWCLTTAIADGVRTTITTEGAGDVVFVTYVTQAWTDLYKLLIQEEPVTAASGATDLANEIMGFGTCMGASAGYCIPMDIDDTTATNSVGVKTGSATGALDFHNDEDTEAMTVTYLQMPDSGFILDRLVQKEDASNTTGVNTLDFPLLLWLTSGHVWVDTVDAGMKLILSTEDPETGEASIVWHAAPEAALATAPAAGFTIGLDDDKAVTSAPYLRGRPSEIPNLAQLEVKDGTDLSNVTTKFKAIGIG